MDKIIILDEALITKIAAGEVIENPASVVKELVENSIDAGATKIQIDLVEGGKSYIKVADNGDGMSSADVALSWQRHATSKLKDLHGLFSISTLGFRGEALASIAAVSELSITSRQEDDISGVCLKVTGGKQKSSEETGCPKGTIIEVKNLFFNTPARKKYMRSFELELGNISEIITKYALILPKIHFRLIHGGKEMIDWPAADEWLARISSVYGNKFARDLIPLHYARQELSVDGFISKPSLSRSTKEEQSIYVNGRYIKKNKAISDAINDAYKTIVMVNRYPVAILNLTIRPGMTDVNVHPQKSEIRIQDEKTLYNFILDAIKSAMDSNDLVPEVMKEESVKKIRDFAPGSVFDSGFKKQPLHEGYDVEDSRQDLLVKEDEDISFARLPEMRILGIANMTYIITETKGNLFLIDQHAAAERILYEKFSDQLINKKVAVQQLLHPEVVELTPKQHSLAISQADLLFGLGYLYDDFGRNSVRVMSIPVILGRQFNKELFIDFIEDLSLKEKPDSLSKFFHARIARMSCRTAIKAGDEITLPQIKQYIQGLDENQVYTCPHGRPIMIRWSFYELEKMFKRVV